MARPERMFYFRLALALGYSHPDELLRCLDSRQIAEWLAYYSLEPFGFRMDWLHTGVVASTIANVHRTKRSSRRYAPEDFMPKKPVTDRQSTAEQRVALHQIVDWAKRAGLKVKSRKRGGGEP